MDASSEAGDSTPIPQSTANTLVHGKGKTKNNAKTKRHRQRFPKLSQSDQFRLRYMQRLRKVITTGKGIHCQPEQTPQVCLHDKNSNQNSSRRSEVLWLELQAWYNDRSIFEQDQILFETRRGLVPKVFSVVTAFEFNSDSVDQLDKLSEEMDLVLTNMPAKCHDCNVFVAMGSGSGAQFMNVETNCGGGTAVGTETSVTDVLLKETHLLPLDEALDILGRMLKILCVVENLYPSSSLMAKDYPCHQDPQYQSKVESLCSWFNLVSDLRMKYSSFKQTFFSFLSNGAEDLSCDGDTSANPWPFMGAEFNSFIREYSNGLLKKNSVKSVLRTFIKKYFTSLFRTKMNLMPISHYVGKFHTAAGSSTGLKHEGKAWDVDLCQITPDTKMEQTDEVERLISEINHILPTVNIQTIWKTSIGEMFRYAAPISPPSRLDAIFSLPSIQPLYAFFPMLLFAVMKHCMCLRLEQSAPFFQSDEPVTLLTSRQLIIELKEVLECALFSRAMVHFFMDSVLSNDMAQHFDAVAECYDKDLKCMLTVYLDFLGMWLLRVSCDLPHTPHELHNVLECEWEFTNKISSNMHLETVLDGSNSFVKLSTDLVQSTRGFLASAVHALLKTNGNVACHSPESVNEECNSLCETLSVMQNGTELKSRAGVLWFVRRISENPHLAKLTAPVVDISVESCEFTASACDDSDVILGETALEDDRRRLFMLCRAVKDLFTEVHERAGRVLRFGKCLRKNLAPAIGFNFIECDSSAGKEGVCRHCTMLQTLANGNYFLVDLSTLWPMLKEKRSLSDTKAEQTSGEDFLVLTNYWIFLSQSCMLSFKTLEKLLLGHLWVIKDKFEDDTSTPESGQYVILVRKPDNAQIVDNRDTTESPDNKKHTKSTPKGKNRRKQNDGCGHCGSAGHRDENSSFLWSGKAVNAASQTCDVETYIKILKNICINFELAHDVTIILPSAANVGMVRNDLCKVFSDFAKLDVGQMPVISSLKKSFAAFNQEVIRLCRSMMESIRSATDFLEDQSSNVSKEGQMRVVSLDVVFGEQVKSEVSEVLQSCYNCSFDIIKDAIKMVSGDLRAELNEIHVDFVRLWMRYVTKHREKGKGVRPRWASHGLSFLVSIEPTYLLAMRQKDFADLQHEIDTFMLHLIGTVPPKKSVSLSLTSDSSWSSLSHESLLASGVLRSLSNSSSCSPIDGALPIDFGGERYEDDDDNTSPGASSSIERVRSAIVGVEAALQDRRYAAKTVGHVSHATGDSQTINLGPRTANFRWQRGTMIGQGAFGRVYSCVNLDTRTILAMKEVKFQQNDHQKIKVALDEFSNFEGIKHDNLVQYYGVELHREEMYIFMEFCDGGTLAELCKIGLPELIIRHYSSQILAAVHTLHANGIIHRDIKGSNIFMTSTGVVKLGDFGSALKLNDKHKTATGEMVSYIGTTLAYTAPEVINASNVGYGRASDIWSLGCVVIEMASGNRPWRDLESFQIMYKVGLGYAPPLPKLSEQGKDFVRMCTIFDPQGRWSAEKLFQHSFIKLAGANIL